MDLATIIGIVATISGIFIAWIGVRRSFKVDKATENAAVVAAQTGSVGQVIAGLNTLIENLQEDNKIWRENFKELSLKLSEVIKERDQIQKDYETLAKKYGIGEGDV